MLINKEELTKLDTDKNESFTRFITSYPEFNGTLNDLLLLDKITFSDKVWIITALLSKEQNIKFAIQCGLAVLDIFESSYPDDKRPRIALEMSENWLLNPTEENRQMVVDASYAAYSAYALYDTHSYTEFSSAMSAAASSAAHASYAAANSETDTTPLHIFHAAQSAYCAHLISNPEVNEKDRELFLIKIVDRTL